MVLTPSSAIKKALRINRWALDGQNVEYYFAAGAASGAAAGAVEVIVEVIVDAGMVLIAGCSAGFGASSCFWHPAKAKIVTTVNAAMIAVIFFMVFHPLSSQVNINSGVLVAM